MLKILIIFLLCVSSLINGNCFASELNEQGSYDFDLGENDAIMLTGIADAHTRKYIEMMPGDTLTFSGSKGTFLIAYFGGDDHKAFFPGDASYTFKKKAIFYTGFYYPDIDNTGHYNTPLGTTIKLTIDKSKRIESNYSVIEPLNMGKHYTSTIKSSFYPHMAGIISLTTFILVFKYFYKKNYTYYESRVKSARSFVSMRKLGENYNFLCIHCGEKLKTVGRFECELGHVPKIEKSIFKKCGVDDCPYEYTTIICIHCGEKIRLDENNYNEEAIKNKGKEFILRYSPGYICANIALAYGAVASFAAALTVYLLQYYIGNLAYESNIYQVLREVAEHNYSEAYGNWARCKNMNPISFYLFGMAILVLIGSVIVSRKKKIIVRNPYEK